MDATVKIGVAAAGGYLLGRTKKAKTAITLALWLSGRNYRLSDIARDQGAKLLKSQEGQQLVGQLRGPALTAGKQALLALWEAQAAKLADSLQQRVSGGQKQQGGEQEQDEGEQAQDRGEKGQGEKGQGEKGQGEQSQDQDKDEGAQAESEQESETDEQEEGEGAQAESEQESETDEQQQEGGEQEQGNETRASSGKEKKPSGRSSDRAPSGREMAGSRRS